jgi:hypothetical protein
MSTEVATDQTKPTSEFVQSFTRYWVESSEESVVQVDIFREVGGEFSFQIYFGRKNSPELLTKSGNLPQLARTTKKQVTLGTNCVEMAITYLRIGSNSLEALRLCILDVQMFVARNLQ